MAVSKLRYRLSAMGAFCLLASCSMADRDDRSSSEPVLQQGSSQSSPAAGQKDVQLSPNPWPGQNVGAPTPLTGTAAHSGDSLAGGGSGPSGPSGRIDVNFDRVRLDVARNLKIDASKVPATLELPVTVAARLCGVDARVLAAQRQPSGGKPTCMANNAEMATDVVEPSIE